MYEELPATTVSMTIHSQRCQLKATELSLTPSSHTGEIEGESCPTRTCESTVIWNTSINTGSFRPASWIHSYLPMKDDGDMMTIEQ